MWKAATSRSIAAAAAVLAVCACVPADAAAQAGRSPADTIATRSGNASPVTLSKVNTDRSFDPVVPIRDFGGTVYAFGRDLWLTVSAPLWMDRQAWAVTGGVVAAGGVLFLFDDDITRLALRNEDEPVFDQVLEVGTFFEPVGLMGNTNVWFAAGAVTSYAIGLDQPKRMFTELLYSQWIAGMVRQGTNKLVGRARPHRERGARSFDSGNGTSFPSGHASTVFQVATVLSHHANRTPVSIVLYGLAGTVAWQRVADEQHWASDVWLGAAYGWAVAKLVVRLHEEDALDIQPVTGPSGGLGLGLSLRFR